MLAKKIIKFERSKLHCNVGTIGHVDHGKTTLTAAITKLLAGIGNTVYKSYETIAKCPEEQNRGITISAAHIEYETERRHYSHIDCPGHQQYVKNMLTGAVNMDGAILVVAANDGPQIQTREHVMLAKEVGISYIIVYLNKVDLKINEEMKELVILEILELLENYGFPGDSPVIKGSAKTAIQELEKSEIGMLSVAKLMETVDNFILQPTSKLEGPFMLSIESSLQVAGRGTVVTGKVETGQLKINDELDLVSSLISKTSCMGIEMFKKSLQNAQCGDNVGVLLKKYKRKRCKKR